MLSWSPDVTPGSPADLPSRPQRGGEAPGPLTSQGCSLPGPLGPLGSQAQVMEVTGPDPLLALLRSGTVRPTTRGKQSLAWLLTAS